MTQVCFGPLQLGMKWDDTKNRKETGLKHLHLYPPIEYTALASPEVQGENKVGKT